MKNNVLMHTKFLACIILTYHLCTIGMDNEKPQYPTLTDDCWVGIFNEQSPKEQLNLASCCTYLHNLYSTRITIASPTINTEKSFLSRVRNSFLDALHPESKNVNSLDLITQKIQTNQIFGTLTIKSKKSNEIDSIFQSLETNNTITTVDLSSCYFTHDHVPHFIDSYMCRKVLLKKIVLNNTSKNNPLDCMDVYLILKSIPTLEEFSYSNNVRSYSFAFSHAQMAILNNEQLAPLGEQLMQLKKLCLRNFFLNVYGLQWLTDALKKNTRLEELDLQENVLFINSNGIDWNLGGIREAADQADSPLKILDLRNQYNKDKTMMHSIPQYQPERSTLTILL